MPALVGVMGTFIALGAGPALGAPINKCTTITKPGSYVLTRNLTVAGGLSFGDGGFRHHRPRRLGHRRRWQRGVKQRGAEAFVEPLRTADADGKFPKERLSDMVRRILRSAYAVGVDKWDPAPTVGMAKHNGWNSSPAADAIGRAASKIGAGVEGAAADPDRRAQDPRPAGRPRSRLPVASRRVPLVMAALGVLLRWLT